MYDILTIGEILAEILSDHVGQVFYRPGRLFRTVSQRRAGHIHRSGGSYGGKNGYNSKNRKGRFRPSE